jgi:glycosyltransferase involved in cell wall biosynthesis
VFYYVPAPPARTPVLRDWLVMALCRPFFPRLVFHWHAGGLSEWVQSQAGPLQRALTRWLLGRPDLSLVLRPYHRRDADYFHSRRVVVLPNGIPDPCPDFDERVRPGRERRAQERQRLLAAGDAATDVASGIEDARVFRVLYLSLCRREKGLFDALDAVALANRTLERTPLRVELTVAGNFAGADDRMRFEQRLRAPDLAVTPPAVRQVGFVEGEAKDVLLRASDCLCLPTFLPEGLPVVLLEAMAYGVAPITTTWCDLDEVLPPGYPGAVPAQSPELLAAKLVEFAGRPYDPGLRAYFLSCYTARRFIRSLESALGSLAPQPPPADASTSR